MGVAVQGPIGCGADRFGGGVDVRGAVLVLRRAPYPLDVVPLGAARREVEEFDADGDKFLPASFEDPGHVRGSVVQDDGATTVHGRTRLKPTGACPVRRPGPHG